MLDGVPVEPFTLGVVADTHVPDRARNLHPALIPALRTAGVQAILHAGDISLPRVVRALQQVAPVVAVRGNRDWAFARALPWERRLNFGGVTLALVHGHGTWTRYLWDKWQFWVRGYDLRRYQRTWSHVRDAQVLIFGHTHRAENTWHAGRLWFNPGSACLAAHPTVGLLHFDGQGGVRGEIIDLAGAALVNGQWIDATNLEDSRKTA